MPLPPIRLLVISVCAFGAVAGAAVILHRAPAPPPAATTTATPAPPEDDPGESAAIAAAQGLVRRDGLALIFRMKDGEALTLTDHARCGDFACPPWLATRYRYRGWSTASGGYQIEVTPSAVNPLLLTFDADQPALLDPQNAADPASRPVPLPTRPADAATDPSVADWLSDIAAGRTQTEAPALAASGGAATRDGPALTLHLQGGHALILTDDLACGTMSCPSPVFRSFDYAGRSPDGRFHAILEGRQEISLAHLVDAQTGDATPLLGAPLFSADGRWAAATVTDLEWPSTRRIEIWSLAGPAPSLDFALPAKDGDDTIFEAVAWSDNSHLALRRGAWNAEARSDVTLVHGTDGWHFDR